MRIFFVEDDEIIASGLIYALESEGYEVVYRKDCDSALQAVENGAFSVALLDLSLPDGSGFEICAKIKKRMDIPVIFLTAADDEANTVKGLEMGADDYIAKPFRIRELMARINAVLRRFGQGNALSGVIRFADVEINTGEARVFKSGLEVPLTALEYRLFLTLAQNHGQVLTRNQMLAKLWDFDGEFVNDNTLTVNIKRLREKLGGHSGEHGVIQTVRGVGYRIGCDD